MILSGNHQNDGARGRAYMVIENPQQNPNVVTGTFLLNDHYACILFDSGTEKSFVSSAFTHFINIAPTTLKTSYEVELADGKVVSTNTILRSCTLVLLYNEKTGVYSCQLDEQWFDLSADLLRKALAITPSGDTVIDFVNELGYPEPVEIVSRKTSGNDKPRHPVLQMLWGIVTQTNVDHAELIWEEFTQGIQTFFSHNIHRRPDSAVHHTGDDYILGNLKFVPIKVSQLKCLEWQFPIP
ncbi:hypothetical protein Tco_1298875 [Tanacetum coccineum]